MIILNILCGLLLLVVGVILGTFLHVGVLFWLHDTAPERFHMMMDKYFYSKEEHNNITYIHRDDKMMIERDKDDSK